VFTTCVVAAAVHWLVGMPLAVGFVLGAIVSPPDVVAPLAIVRRLGVPRRLVVVLEGHRHHTGWPRLAVAERRPLAWSRAPRGAGA
jgi:hypothetical protein